LTISLPSSGVADSGQFCPFPDAVTIKSIHEHVEMMNSLQRPRKIKIEGSDGKDYSFLCKPKVLPSATYGDSLKVAILNDQKDDLRKDARMMEFNTVVNKLLKKEADSRKRMLREYHYRVITFFGYLLFLITDIRTYAVIPLNEECGLIEWVPNTVPFRAIHTELCKRYGVHLFLVSFAIAVGLNSF